MPKDKFAQLPPYYIPNASDYYKQYDTAVASVKKAEEEYNQKLGEIQKKLGEIIKKFISNFDKLEAQPIFVSANEEQREPLKKLINEFNQLLSDKKTLTPLVIIQALKTCIDSYTANLIDWDIAKNQLARHRQLKEEFSPYITQLNDIYKTELEACEKANTEHQETVQSFNPAAKKIRDNLEQSLSDALTTIHDAAEKIQSRDLSARGIRSLCEELSIHQKSDTLDTKALELKIKDYTTLVNPSSKSAGWLTAIRKIIDIHNKNKVLCSDPKFIESLKRPHQELEDILNKYLEKRSAMVDSNNHQTKEYYHNSFFCFQKSFTQKKNAVNALIDALNGNPVDLEPHLSTLRNGELGRELRSFIKAGNANSIVDHSVSTVRDFVHALQEQIKPSSSKP